MSGEGYQCETCRSLNMEITEALGLKADLDDENNELILKSPETITKIENTLWEGTKTFECFAGMCETIVPIKGEGRVIGFLKTGQVLLREPTREVFRNALSKIIQLTDSFDVAVLEKAYFETPVIAREKYEAIAVLLKTYADQISKQVHQLILETHHGAPLIVKRAKNYIHLNYSNPIRLDTVALEISTSPFHLSRVFKASTGVGFLEYLNRTRIEHSKELLQKKELRIAEIAYMVGFQSLAPFNKAFRQYVGMIPKEFRKLSIS
jgi:AraC-like DNA-binding protein